MHLRDKKYFKLRINFKTNYAKKKLWIEKKIRMEFDFGLVKIPV